MNEKEKVKKCPKCGKEYTGYPAISRTDNKTEICSECGTAEALAIFKAVTEGRERAKKIEESEGTYETTN